MLDIIFAPAAAPFWVFLGVLVTKAFEWVTSKGKAQADAAAQAISGHVNLNNSLQNSFAVMAGELARLREDRERDAAEWDVKEARYQDRIKNLEEELLRLQSMVLSRVCPECAKGHI